MTSYTEWENALFFCIWYAWFGITIIIYMFAVPFYYIPKFFIDCIKFIIGDKNDRNIK